MAPPPDRISHQARASRHSPLDRAKRGMTKLAPRARHTPGRRPPKRGGERGRCHDQRASLLTRRFREEDSVPPRQAGGANGSLEDQKSAESLLTLSGHGLIACRRGRESGPQKCGSSGSGSGLGCSWDSRSASIQLRTYSGQLRRQPPWLRPSRETTPLPGRGRQKWPRSRPAARPAGHLREERYRLARGQR